MELINQGAEAQIFKVDDLVVKFRVSKKYRLDFLDLKVRKKRTRREFKVLTKLYEAGVRVPKPVEENLDEFKLVFEYIKGDVLKDVLTKDLLFDLFRNVIKMHSLDIVHFDLTTLNAIVKDERVFLIDFGLSEFNSKVEQKAEDLNLLFTNIRNEHPEFYFLKRDLENLYSKFCGEDVVQRLRNIEKRGRNKGK